MGGHVAVACRITLNHPSTAAMRLMSINILSKYADDINLIVPQYYDVDLATEFDNIQHWAMCNKMTINLSKTKEIVFRRPCPLRYRPNFVPSINGVALVDHNH